MNKSTHLNHSPLTAVLTAMLTLVVLLLGLICSGGGGGLSQAQQNNAQRTPTETVREFYQALSEKRFREAFAISIYRPAIEGLSAEMLAELRPDFERMSAAVPGQIQITGEQISGDTATVFIKISSAGDAADAKPEPVSLVRAGDVWIVGDKENQQLVKQSGREFFIAARIDTHHSEVQALLQRIAAAEIAYGAQHNGQFADLPTLLKAGLVPKDIETSDSTGYRFRVTLAGDNRNYAAQAEPVRYNLTGRLSFYMNITGIKSRDTGGKPFKP